MGRQDRAKTGTGGCGEETGVTLKAAPVSLLTGTIL